MICPLLPLDEMDVRRARPYRDADSPGGDLVSRLQRRLRALGAEAGCGRLPQITGVYDLATARALARWTLLHLERWPSWPSVRAAWGHRVTDCAVWRAVGFDCEAVEIVPGVTPEAEEIRRAVERGDLDLACVQPAPDRHIEWLWLLLGASGVVLAVSLGHRQEGT